VFERRKARRFSVSWPVRIEGYEPSGSSFEEAGELENLSSSGAFLNIARPIEIGTTLNIAIRVPFQSERWMKYSAEVIRVEQEDPSARVGIRFSTPRPAFSPHV
jgi:hypothetical protein